MARTASTGGSNCVFRDEACNSRKGAILSSIQNERPKVAITRSSPWIAKSRTETVGRFNRSGCQCSQVGQKSWPNALAVCIFNKVTVLTPRLPVIAVDRSLDRLQAFGFEMFHG